MATPFRELTPLAIQKLGGLADFYNGSEAKQGWGSSGYSRMLAHYYNLMIPPGSSVLEIGCGDGGLLAEIRAERRVGLDLSERRIEQARQSVPGCEFHVGSGELLDLEEKFDVIILSETVNEAADVQVLLQRLLAVSHPQTRLLLNFFNNLFQPLSALATLVGARGHHLPANWLSTSDVKGLLGISGWETVTTNHRILFPFQVPGVDFLLNRCLAPLFPPLCITIFCTARPKPAFAGPLPKQLSVSVLIPARNEEGNIEAAVLRTPDLGSGTELIFVEGHSSDGTWAEIQRVAAAYPEKKITCLRQRGEGKGDAVREGFAAAMGDILMILDADLTVQPEELPKFYDAIASGQSEFANGVRLVYPMERESMRFLNLCANKAFGMIFSWMLGQPVKDTLCGTKVLLRSDYLRLAAGRSYFGEFDPFGDFDLLFGAGKLGLRITEIPIRYRERTYGSTNIRRWHHGTLLLRMVVVAARKLKFL
jgi:SAM-dependent methyltransferase